MPSKNGFIAGLIVLALCGFVAGGISLYKNIEFWLYGQDATMELADPDATIVAYEDVLNTRTLDVRYVSDAGELVVANKVVSKEVSERLVAGKKITITYLTNRPTRVFYAYQSPPNPWAWLVVGIVALAVAIYALRLHKRELKDTDDVQ